MLTIQTFPVNPLQSNCYVVSDATGEAVVLDDGAYTHYEQAAILDYLSSHHLRPLHHLLTHGHFDHCFGAATLVDTYGLRPEVHSADAPLIAAMDEQCQSILHCPLPLPMPAVGRYFSAADTYSFGTHTLRILHTPGHSPGSVAFICDEEGLLFGGDTLFCGGVGRTDFMGGDLSALMVSLSLLTALDANMTVFPGHGPATTIGSERAHNPFLAR